MKNLGDKIREAVPGLSELPSPGEAVQAGKDLVGKLPSAGDVQGARPRNDESSADTDALETAGRRSVQAPHCAQDTGKQPMHCYT